MRSLLGRWLRRTLAMRLSAGRIPLPVMLEALDRHSASVSFLQIGANDGLTGDPTADFKRRPNWGGVLVEPQPAAFQQLQANFPEARYRNVNAAMDAVDGFRTLYTLSLSTSRWASGLATFNREVLLANFRNGYIPHMAGQEGIDPARLDDVQSCITGTEVPTLCMATLLSRCGNPTFDAVFIDVEGYDLEIIRLLPLDSPTLRLLVYEHCHLSVEARKQAVDILQRQGFMIVPCGVNTVAVRNLSLPLMVRV
jgi:FkbM family methyltransferase